MVTGVSTPGHIDRDGPLFEKLVTEVPISGVQLVSGVHGDANEEKTHADGEKDGREIHRLLVFVAGRPTNAAGAFELAGEGGEETGVSAPAAHGWPAAEQEAEPGESRAREVQADGDPAAGSFVEYGAQQDTAGARESAGDNGENAQSRRPSEQHPAVRPPHYSAGAGTGAEAKCPRISASLSGQRSRG